jgi:hypothetical protein
MVNRNKTIKECFEENKQQFPFEVEGPHANEFHKIESFNGKKWITGSKTEWGGGTKVWGLVTQQKAANPIIRCKDCKRSKPLDNYAAASSTICIECESYLVKKKNTSPKGPHKCSCDFYKVVLVKGCVCGGL